MKKFENAEMEVRALEVEDIVTTSNTGIGGDGSAGSGEEEG